LLISLLDIAVIYYICIGWLILEQNIAGTTIDQGIAYVLMLVALVLTYLIHWSFCRFNFGLYL